MAAISPYRKLDTGDLPLIPEPVKPKDAYRGAVVKAVIFSALIGFAGLIVLVVLTSFPIRLVDERPTRMLHTIFRDENFDEHYRMFQKFIYEFDRVYESVEEMELRFAQFRKNLENIQKLKHLEELTSTIFGINEFADMSDGEFKQMLLPKNFFATRRINTSFVQPLTDELMKKLRRERNLEAIPQPFPKHFDWRDKGVVTPVKAQGNCGSCWAFATAATVETQFAIDHGRLRNLSEQELLDCNLDNNACNGGDVDKAFNFVHKFGLMLEDEYPYVARRQNVCSLPEHENNTTKLSMSYFINPTEEAIMEWLVSFGPVNIGINVPPDMKPYTGGVYRPSDWDCTHRILGTHALNIVGYGEMDDGEKYWIVKNSWGQNWGIQNGYVYFARGLNSCGVEDEPIGILT